MTSCLLCAILLLGCTSSSLEEPRKQEPSSNASSSYGGGLRSSDLATILSSTEFTLEDFSELSQLVRKNAEIGYDEKFFLSDLAKLRSAESNFATKLSKVLSTTQGLRSAEASSLSLYWMERVGYALCEGGQLLLTD